MEEILRVWPLATFVLVQCGGFLFWMGRITAHIADLKKHSDVSAKNGERLATIEGQLTGISTAIANIQSSLPKRRGS